MTEQIELQQIIDGKTLYHLNETQLLLDGDAKNPKRAGFKCTALSTGYNAYFYRFSEESIRSLVPQARKTDDKNGVPVHILHQSYWELPVGRTLNATFQKKRDLVVDAYVSRDVPNPDTNSIIDRMSDDTIDSVSISWGMVKTGKKPSYYKNDITGEKMDRGYFMPYDKNYHYPGKKLEDGRIVTATVHGNIKFRELSIVGAGADPRAKMLSDTEFRDALATELSELDIQRPDIPTIAALSGWDESLFSDTLSLGVYNLSSEKKLFSGFDTKPESTGGNTPMAEPTTPTETPEMPESDAAKEWEKLYNQNLQELNTLKTELEDMVSREDHESQLQSLRDEIDELKLEKNDAEAVSSENQVYAKIGIEAVAKHRERASNAFKLYRQNKVSDAESQRTLQKIEESTNITWLQGEADHYWNLMGEHQKNQNLRDSTLAVSQSKKEHLEGVEANVSIFGR